MIVVFDTNIWKENLYLRSSASAAVKFFLQDHRAKVGLPEVVRLEVEKHLRADVYECRDQIRKRHSDLLGLFGQLRELVLPTDPEIEALVGGFFSQSGFSLQEVPFSEDSARDSFLRTVDKVPPSHRSQEFKDGLIWKDCKTLANAEDVVLVTADRAFYERDDRKNGLAMVLAEEADQCRYKLRVFSKLTELLCELKRPIVVEDDVFEHAVSGFLRPHVDTLLEREQFTILSPWRFEKSLFATEHHASLYVEFIAVADCEDIRSEGRANSVIQITADCLYLLETKTLSNVQVRDLELTFTFPDGRLERIRSMFGALNIAIGRRTVTHMVRRRLDDFQ